MSDNRNEAEEKMAKAIFISADCWLCVYDLLPASQLGLGIAMISHRFDFYVDEHFKTRFWTLGSMKIKMKFEADGTKEMDVVNANWESFGITQKPLPKRVVGFKAISLKYFNNNAITFLHRFRPILAARPIHLTVGTYFDDRTLELIWRNIWPMIATNIRGIQLSKESFYRLRKFVPSILDDCPSLRVVNANSSGFFTEFPADDNAEASEGQTVVKWLFTPRPDNVPKVFKCWLERSGLHLVSRIEDFKATFANASSPVNFIAIIHFPSPFGFSVVPFVLTNELTREQLTLKKMNDIRRVLLIRSPIVRDESKWTKWEEEAIGWNFMDQWNRIDI